MFPLFILSTCLSILYIKATNDLIRSERACRLDLRRWSCKYEKNTGKPYWAGHERVDVIEARKAFVQYFLIHKQSCYLISAGNNPEWIIPQNNPTILLCMSFIYWILQ